MKHLLLSQGKEQVPIHTFLGVLVPKHFSGNDPLDILGNVINLYNLLHIIYNNRHKSA